MREGPNERNKEEEFREGRGRKESRELAKNEPSLKCTLVVLVSFTLFQTSTQT